MEFNYDSMSQLATLLTPTDGYNCFSWSPPNSEEFLASCAEAADSMYEQELKKPLEKQRTYEQILLNVTQGFAAECCIAGLIKGELNPDKFDHTKPNTFFYDLLGPLLEKIEIKTKNWKDGISEGNKWILNEEGMNAFEENAFRLDYVIYAGCRYSEEHKTFLVAPRLIANAKTFFKEYVDYHHKSSTRFYKSIVAIGHNQCIKITNF